MVKTADQTPATPGYLSLVRSPTRRLTALMRRGGEPDLGALSGWEWRGTNLPASSRLLGIRRFIKGFETVEGRALGYNVSVVGSDLTSPWAERRQRDGRREWARFTVSRVDATGRDNRYLNALLLDYGGVASPERGIAGRLRDYVVQVSPGSNDLLLGHAFLAVGRTRIPVGWFALERLRERPTVGPQEQPPT
ncbi:hypothetical protein N865_16770 [Intrasporangium oryzae NRRL B-24470]|uniref:Uncharacterized protein n=1 Tax=Intrasporangium oryzae NRRL B-24470 TaxID=1386089 RepID=W9GE83_9MICO|nr:hypothetical protein [Intrasporangium oryzae]EWT03517.1 hypothetical protein N865_16770 [Intrasporangium oryzae NRRL B-24470]